MYTNLLTNIKNDLRRFDKVKISEIVVSEAIIKTYADRLLSSLATDVAIVGGGPAGLMASYCLAKNGIKAMPIFLLNEKNIVHSGSFPEFDILNKKLKLLLAEDNYSWFTILYRIINAIPYLIDHYEYFMSAGKSCGIRYHDKFSDE